MSAPEPPLQIAVAALLRGGAGGPEVLIARRRADAIRGGLWELPGGKAEPGEAAADAARRELAEETGIVLPAGSGHVLGGVSQHDPHLPAERRLELTLVAFAAPADARPQPLAAAECRWESVERLDGYEWPAANRRLNEILRAHVRAWPSGPGPASR